MPFVKKARYTQVIFFLFLASTGTKVHPSFHVFIHLTLDPSDLNPAVHLDQYILGWCRRIKFHSKIN